MKLICEKNDVYSVMGQLNNNSFIQSATAESQEAWGLPIFKKLLFTTENDCFKDDRVKKAAKKVKEYAKKKGWKIATPKQAQENKTTLFSWLSEGDAIAKGTKANYYNPRFIQFDGILLAATNLTFARHMAKHKADTIGATTDVAMHDTISRRQSGQNMIATVVAGALVYAVGALLIRLTHKKKATLFATFVPFVKDNNKLVWKKFGYFLITKYSEKGLNTTKVSKESLDFSLEADNDEIDVEMDALVKDEECPICDAGKDSETVDVSDISESQSAHNEEASAGGIVVGENAEDLEMDPIAATEAFLFREGLFSMEELDQTEQELEETPIEIVDTGATPEVDLDLRAISVGGQTPVNEETTETAEEATDSAVADITEAVLPDQDVDMSEEALDGSLFGWQL